jgi:NADPH:quinone reductase-like Zn-dependent oxidoreductase/SAM-dependent methyltransferase/NADP-dependent 3-hydroxy acid dehydrogenase YdfG/acyl carrier protein
MNIMNTMPLSHGHSMHELEMSWRNKVDENLPFVARLVENEDPHFLNALNALALCWTSSQFNFRRGSDQRFAVDESIVIDPHFADYRRQFLGHCNAFAAPGLAEHLGLEAGIDLLLMNPVELTAKVLAQLPQAAIEIDLIQRTGRQLVTILRREIGFLEALSPKNDTTMLEAMYYGSSSAILNNVIFSGVFETVCGMLGRKLKVLEVGAGTGGATASIIHAISAHCSEYWFTDVSNVFLATARRRFPRQSFKYGILDINDPASFEALEQRGFDLIIGSNAVHTARVLRNTLADLNRLLRPGGAMLLAEATRLPAWTEFIFGAAPEWWQAVDPESRTLGPLSSEAQWQDMLLESIGPSMPLVTEEMFPIVDKYYFDALPQVIVAFKSADEMIIASSGSLPVPQPVVEEASPAAVDEEALVPAITILVSVELDSTDDNTALLARIGAERHICLPVQADPAKLDVMLSELPPGPKHFLLTLDHEAQRAAIEIGAQFDPALLKQWYSVLAFLRAIVSAVEPHPVTVLTAGTCPIGDHPVNYAVYGYSGIFLAVLSEYPTALLRHFDLDPALDSEERLRVIACLLERPFRVEERAVRGGKLLEPVLKRSSLIRPDLTRPSSLFPRPAQAHAPGYRVQIGKPRIFEDLVFSAEAERPLAEDEIEVSLVYVALNYRDVMKVLGEYPLDGGDYLSLGDEGAGFVTRCGVGVDSAMVGKRVLIIGEALLGSSCVVKVDQVLELPDDMPMNGAATLPVAFLTAEYSLVHQGKLAKGEHVLIHAAAGGLGLAAIRVAKACGAIVHATASEPKQDTVRYWGADYVYDSRTVDFEHQVRANTGGRGVDVVLNSLSGAFQAASMQALAECGRFVEVGKRDIYEHRSINQYVMRRNISFHVVDMSHVAKAKPEIWKALANTLNRKISAGEYTPIPFRMYRASHVALAMRTMASGRHLGKILLMMQDPAVVPTRETTRSRGSFARRQVMVFGGTSGVGLELATAQAMAGGRKVTILGRGTADSASITALMAEFADHKNVHYQRCDVTDRASVEAAITACVDLNGDGLEVYLASGIYRDELLKDISEQTFLEVTAPKVMGAVHLHQALKAYRPEVFCMLSSVSSMLGNAGQTSYAAANAFLDGMALARHNAGLAGTVVNFGPFSDIGHLADKPELRTIVERLGSRFVPKYFAIKALENATTMGVGQVGFFDMDWHRFVNHMRFETLPAKLRFVVGDAVEDKGNGEGKIDILKELEGCPPEDRLKKLETYIIHLVSGITGTDVKLIDPTLDLATQGLDSLSTIEMALSIQGNMKLELQPEDLGQARDPRAVAKVLLEKYNNKQGAA